MLGEPKRHDTGEVFHYFNVEELIPEDHLLRRIDAVLDLSWVREELAGCYAAGGRPSWDPEVIVRMMLLGYLYGLSEARLVDEVRMHMGYRWFCLLQPSDKVPDRTTLVKLRNERWKQEIWERILERTVEQCVEAGLVSGRHVSLDGTKIRANASIGSLEPIEPPASLKDHLRERCGWDEVESSESEGRAEGEEPGKGDDDEPRPGGTPDFRGKKLDNRGMRSWTDPDARLYRKGDGVGAELAYLGHFAADTKSRVILAAEATRAHTSAEWEAGERLIELANQRVGGRVEVVTADKGYGVRRFLGVLRRAGIRPHIAVQGKRVKRRVRRPRVLCRRVVPLGAGREAIERIRAEEGRNQAIDEMGTVGYQVSRRLRTRIEHLFAEAKTVHGMARARSRGLAKVDAQVKLTAAVMNLKRLAQAMRRRATGVAAARPPRHRRRNLLSARMLQDRLVDRGARLRTHLSGLLTMPRTRGPLFLLPAHP